MQKHNLRMQKLNFPGTHWRGLALTGAKKIPWRCIIQEMLTGRVIKAGQGKKAKKSSQKS